MTPLDIVQGCKIIGHTIPDCIPGDQLMSAVTSAYPKTATLKRLQALLGMGGLLIVGKQVDDKNKEYLSSRRKAYCASAGVTNMLGEKSIGLMVKIIMSAQKLLYQTSVGREYATRVIDQTVNPEKLRDQIIMIYQYCGMKAAVLMSPYIGLALIVLAIPEILKQTKQFKPSYEHFQQAEGTHCRAERRKLFFEFGFLVG